MPALTVAFLLIALLYSAIGLGGGSSYLLALAYTDVSYIVLPKLGLICNLIVVSGGLWHFRKQGHINLRLTLPFVMSSVPFAFLGGLYPVTEAAFRLLLSVSLVLAAIRLFFLPEQKTNRFELPGLLPALVIGALLGFLSGVTALGGGIFLSPLLMNLRWGKVKEIAATATVFIFLNSLSGLCGQFVKTPDTSILKYWPLFVAVFIGGQIGSRFGSKPSTSLLLIQRGTAVLVLLISGQLLFKTFRNFFFGS